MLLLCVVLGCVEKVDVENGLVRLKDHTRVHLEVFIQVEPCAVRAWLIVAAVAEDPGLLFLGEGDVGLRLGEQLVVDSNVALGGATDDDRAS